MDLEQQKLYFIGIADGFKKTLETTLSNGSIPSKQWSRYSCQMKNLVLKLNLIGQIGSHCHESAKWRRMPNDEQKISVFGNVLKSFVTWFAKSDMLQRSSYCNGYTFCQI